MNPQPVGVPAKGPRYPPGEIVGIAEPWCLPRCFDEMSGAEVVNYMEAPEGTWSAKPHGACQRYVADGAMPDGYGRIRLSRFIPDAFIRTKILILAVAAERVQDITEAQAKAEGVEPVACCEHFPQPSLSYVRAFSEVWDELHPEYPWEKNYFVWRYQFELAG